MDRIEKIIKEYSTKKLQEIIEQQSSSYNSNFIDYAKDELIRRGESFSFNEELIKEVAEMNDDDLKKLVEQEYDTYHLEYIEIARKEYLKRGFKNETSDDNEQKETFEKRYPASRTIAGVISFIAWTVAVITVIIAFIGFSNLPSNSGGMEIIIPLGTLIIGAFFFIILLSQSEMIKVFIDIEENTRKYSDYYKNSEDNQEDNQNGDNNQA